MNKTYTMANHNNELIHPKNDTYHIISTDWINIYIPSTLRVSTHILYTICIENKINCQTWMINRRYSQFLALKTSLINEFRNAKSTCPGCASYLLSLYTFHLPSKTWSFLSFTDHIIKNRKEIFEKFIKLIVKKTFNDKIIRCITCGMAIINKHIHPFLIRGAHGLDNSNKIISVYLPHQMIYFDRYHIKDDKRNNKNCNNSNSSLETATCSSLSGFSSTFINDNINSIHTNIPQTSENTIKPDKNNKWYSRISFKY